MRESLGRYLVEAEIGRGAMGVVYRARDPKIDRLVALKTISLAEKEEKEEQEYRERFVQEARAAGRLSHPGIVTIHDAGEDSETHEPFFVMEYVAGQPLSDTLADAGGKLPVSEALRFACEIADALQYAHERGVIHGDIKPANILVTAEGRAKIADFGVARLNQSVATHAGKIFGSPAYMAPEQLSGHDPDARSDLFSLGVMLYSMLTGFRPFQGNSAATVCFKVMNVEPVPVTAFQAELPPELDHIVSRAIAKNPEQRYQSGAELAAEIRAFMRNDASIAEATTFFTRVLEQDRTARREQHSIRVSKRLVWQLALAVLLIAISLTAWEFGRQYAAAGKLEPPRPAVVSAPPIQKSPASLASIETRFVEKRSKHSSPERPRAAAQLAKMRVDILHHFPSGKASVWLDQHLILDQQLSGDHHHNTIFHSVEMDETANLELASGKHKLLVRVVSPAESYDSSEALEATISAGPQHILYINCEKKKLQVTLQ